ncbi:cbb3-type cytochrome c oxidase N-terminal domain-containing protein [Parasediminibacterium sp. JCM 36343]|uniref:cbb3-type cytochrome c oxidase N-terminal domain-containing protein n=1 Tax=Parasediminibacterium sp. JCM 36343 TaxID=3374279 RepID=UPI00397AD5B1
MLNLVNNKWSKSIAVFLAVCASPQFSFAEGRPLPSSMDDPRATILIVIMAALLLIIGLLAFILLGAAQLYLAKDKEEKKNGTSIGAGLKITALLVGLIISSGIIAQESVMSSATPATGSLSIPVYFTLIAVITLELVIIFALLYNLQLLLRKELAVAAKQTEPKKIQWAVLWEKINSFKSAKEEQDIDLGHDYDGIRELDNNLPPWWIYGFYLCIFIGVVYLWRFHVSYSAPLSKEEYEISVQAAAIEKEAYLANAANNVDENTVTLLTGSADLEAGKKVFTTVCAACHVADGGGAVGPNLTDDYWLHGSSIKDVFKTIKYGWQEKGMKSWKDDYSPVQIAQLASYVKSLHGTKTAKPKDPQGELFKESTVKDTTAAKTVASK